ncbi:hypothetical protein IHQ68_08795 [Chelatococcus sambhunathii]|uniref:Uncharacterized protein n=1 Tax=Chelatococcus sambhunathii TaxID=363953 RepID=A0ABU1DF35_9HYPH|nr:hypothetical protein [Chelatococcus sambhunathii]MDR4306714.1 hypothetical protein [Chelatococcus sambhunathii]
MRRLFGALLAASLSAGAATAAEPHAWPDGPEPSTIQADPWSGDAAAVPHEDAFVFEDIAQTRGLSAEAVAAATRSDLARLAGAPPDPGPSRDRATGAGARVDWSFGRFVAIGDGGAAYAPADVTRGRAGPASLAETDVPGAAAFAMIAGR